MSRRLLKNDLLVESRVVCDFFLGDVDTLSVDRVSSRHLHSSIEIVIARLLTGVVAVVVRGRLVRRLLTAALKKQPKDAALVGPHRKFGTQTVLLAGPTKALDLTEKATYDAGKPERVKPGNSDENPFVCADCYVGFLADWVK